MGCGWTQPFLVQHAPPASGPCLNSRLLLKVSVGKEGKFKTVLSSEGYVSSKEFQKLKQWHFLLQNSITSPDKIQRFIGSVLSLLGTLFHSSDYGDKCNKC